MESVRVRGCAGGPDLRQADASRRQNGPRKTERARYSERSLSRVSRDRRSRCGLEVRPAVHVPSDTARLSPRTCGAASAGEKVGSGEEAARASAGGCGVEDQVGRTDSAPMTAGEL